MKAGTYQKSQISLVFSCKESIDRWNDNYESHGDASPTKYSSRKATNIEKIAISMT